MNPDAALIDAVRHYVHFDNLAETLTKQVTNARTMRSNYEERILKHLDQNNMKNAILQVNGATLQRSTRSKSTDLSWGFVEEQLHEYYKSRSKPDETKAILEFFQRNRGVKTTEYLKKTTAAEALVKKTPSS
jgi:hypothetical protein